MVTLLHWKNCLHFLTGSHSISWVRRGLKCRTPELDPSVLLTRAYPVALMNVVKRKVAGAGPWMGGQPSAWSRTPQLDSGVVRAPGTHAHKSDQHHKKSFQEGVGTRVPARPFYTRPAEPVSLCQWKPQNSSRTLSCPPASHVLPTGLWGQRRAAAITLFLGDTRGTTSLKAAELAAAALAATHVPRFPAPSHLYTGRTMGCTGRPGGKLCAHRGDRCGLGKSFYPTLLGRARWGWLSG